MSGLDAIEVANGARRAVFRRTGAGWTPEWFYEGQRPMLRFKDHEWLSIGHVRPTAASRAELLPDGAAFSGVASNAGPPQR